MDGRGGGHSIELAIVMPLVLLMFFTAVQAGLWYHARNVAQTAAAHCAENARYLTAGPGDGYRAALVITNAGGISDPRVAVHTSATMVSCTVSGTGPTLLAPLGTHTRTVSMPRERIT